MVWIEHRIHISSKRKKSEEIADSVVKFSKHVCSDVVMCVFVSNYSLYTSKGSYSPTLVYISLLVFVVDLWIHICSYIYIYMFAFFLWGYLDWKSDGELRFYVWKNFWTDLYRQPCEFVNLKYFKINTVVGNRCFRLSSTERCCRMTRTNQHVIWCTCNF